MSFLTLLYFLNIIILGDLGEKTFIDRDELLYLIIIESPGKIKKFKQVLGSEYEIVPTLGHFVDLPVNKFSVDIKNGFKPKFEIQKTDVAKSLRTHAKSAKEIFIMTDEDREGAGIAFEVYETIKDYTKAKIWRSTTNSITKEGITKAIKNPLLIQEDSKKNEAFLARRILDRICGYKTSFLTFQSTGGKSAGRVQSAMLRIIVEREQEIQHFVPEEYWILTAQFSSPKKERYTGVLTDKIKVPDKKTATEIYEKVIKGNPLITLVETKETPVNPLPPFTTLPMIASASSILGFTAKRTMSTAQDLYTEGKITYHRSDSPTMDPEAITSIRSFVQSEYGTDYLPSFPNIYHAKKGAQEAHECCRPTDINANPILEGDHKKLYDLIWKRAVASQMTPGLDRRIKVVTTVSDYDFISNGITHLFDGFRKCWNYSTSDELILPELQKGDKPILLVLDKDQNFTQAPPRYSDASLSKTAEKLMISRPATFERSIGTLLNRKYIIQKKKSFQPTETGIKVVDFLKEANICFIDLDFTKNMEEQLDEIQEGKKNKVDLLTDFWNRLKADIENAKTIKQQKQVTNYVCPKCGSYLLLKHSKFGPFYSCQNYKKSGGCSYMANVAENGDPIEKVLKDKKNIEYMDFVCNKCGFKMIKRKGKYGEFAGCEKFPKCNCTADLYGNFKETKNKKWSNKNKENED